MDAVKIMVVPVRVPEKANIIIGQAHFIKTVEDLYEAIIGSVPGVSLGVAFCEASGDRLVRVDGNDEELKNLAAHTALEIGAGHVFVIYLKGAWPINVLNAIKNVHEVASIFCATANPLQVIIVETAQGRGVLGVVDGYKPLGIEDENKKQERIQFLRRIGYKRG
ncbi:MAG: adenosine-specific kinase [Thermofilaceae archaeon]